MRKIFNSIENLGLWIAKFAIKRDGHADIWNYYGVGLITSLFTFLVGFILAIIFGYVIPMLFVSLIFAWIRPKIGGYHCSEFWKCVVSSNMIFIIGSMLALVCINHSELFFLTTIFGVIFITPYIPKKYSENTPERGEKRKEWFRKKYRNRVLILYVINIILLYLISRGIDLRIFSTSISSALMMIVCVMTNTYDKTMEKIFE